MEVDEIKNALVDFLPLVREANEVAEPNHDVREHMLDFLQKVLGYDLNEDIVFKHLAALPERPKETNFDQKIKFVMTTLPSKTKLDETQGELAIEYALAAPTNVVMLSNGVDVCFYSVDNWEGKWETDILVAVNLLKDPVDEMAQTLWALAKKDCHRKIWVTVPTGKDSSSS